MADDDYTIVPPGEEEGEQTEKEYREAAREAEEGSSDIWGSGKGGNPKQGLARQNPKMLPGIDDPRYIAITAIRTQDYGVRVGIKRSLNGTPGWDHVSHVNDITGDGTGPGSSVGLNNQSYIFLYYGGGSSPSSATYSGSPINANTHWRTYKVVWQSGYSRNFQILIPSEHQRSPGYTFLWFGGTANDFRVYDCWTGPQQVPYEWKGTHFYTSQGGAYDNKYACFTGTLTGNDPGNVFVDYASTYQLSDITSTPSGQNIHDHLLGATTAYTNSINYASGTNSAFPFPDQDEGGIQEFQVIVEDRKDEGTNFWSNLQNDVITNNYTQTFSQQIARLSATNTISNPTYPFSYTFIYAENLNNCGAAPITYDVCDDVQSSNYYLTTGLDCNNNTIPTAALNGSISAIFDGSSNCCPYAPCGIEGAISSTQASYGVSDGTLTIDLSEAGSPGTPSGNPWTSGSQYTITLTNNFGATQTQQNPPSGGNGYTATCTTDVSPSATNSHVAVSSDTTIATGMQVYEAGGVNHIPANTYVGNIITGTLGAVTKFQLVDITGAIVDANNSASVVLTFAAGHTHTFGLLPKAISPDEYTVTIVDNTTAQTCTLYLSTNIDEKAATTGCTDSNAINYDSTANLLCAPNCCIACDASTGLLSDPTGNITGELFGGSSSTSSTSTTDDSTSDGTLFAQANIHPDIVQYIQNTTQTYTLTLYKLTSPGDFSTAGSAIATSAGLTVANVGTSPYDTFTGLAYGYYAVKFQIVDSDGGTQEIEECYSVIFESVLAKVCTNPNATNFNTTVPIDLQESTNSQCTYPVVCCQFSNFQVVNDTLCSAYLEVDISCDPGASSVVGYWELNGTAISGSGFALGTVMSGFATVPLPSNYVTDPNGTYTIQITATYPSGQTCNNFLSQNIAGSVPRCGCTDPTAINYDALATLDDGSCIYPSWDCIVSGTTYQCTDPGTGLGQYATLSACQAVCAPVSIPGCTDSCANNYDPSATIDDGSCIYRACLDPSAANYQYSCDCSQQMPSATISDTSCCFFPCSVPQTLTITTTNTTGTCTAQNSDGTVSVAVVLNNTATTWTISYENNLGVTIHTDITGGNGSGVYTGNTTAQTYTGLSSGTYYAVVTDNFLCQTELVFSIGNTSPLAGCTDPNATNYNPSAQCDDGSCICCGCTDPLAANYNPFATCNTPDPCCECEYNIVDSPCVPKNINKTIEFLQYCLSINGERYLSKSLIGTADNCSIMNNWKLIFIEYLLNKKGLLCLYNCADGATPDLLTTTAGINCTSKWVTGGPVTGIADQGYAGSSIALGEGTTVIDPSTFFVAGNTLYSGDVIKMPSGNIWTVTASAVSCTNACYNPETCLGAQSGHWEFCNDTSNTITVTDSTNYLDNFINFVNTFCVDCGIPGVATNINTNNLLPQAKGGKLGFTQSGITFKI